jgi:hypothetical protein
VNGDGYYRESREFAALTFDYCHGVDRGRWISACGGLEVGWMKIARVERDAAGRGVEVDHSGPLVAPGLGTLLAVRAGPVEPELSLYALFPTVGNAPDGEFLALRATLGAAIPF